MDILNPSVLMKTIEQKNTPSEIEIRQRYIKLDMLKVAILFMITFIISNLGIISCFSIWPSSDKMFQRTKYKPKFDVLKLARKPWKFDAMTLELKNTLTAD